jgi:hypothetical protein
MHNWASLICELKLTQLHIYIIHIIVQGTSGLRCFCQENISIYLFTEYAYLWELYYIDGSVTGVFALQ